MTAEQIIASEGEADLRPSRAGLSTTLFAAVTIGLTPYAIWIDHLTWVPVISALAVAVAAASIWRIKTDASDAPTTGEWLLAGYGTMGRFAICSVAGLTFHGVGWSIAAGLDSLGLIEEGGRSSAGFWTGAFFAFAGALGAAPDAANQLGAWLYKRPAGVRTPFFPLLRNLKKVGRVTIWGCVAFAAVLAFDQPPGTVFCLALSLILFYTSLPLESLARRSTATERGASKAVIDLLEGSGYQTRQEFRTRRADIAPLITDVDVLAWDGEHAFAIDVKRRGRDASATEWTEANGIRTASSVIRDERPEPLTESAQVSPLLVLIGGTVSDSLARFAREQNVLLAHFRDPEVLEDASPAAREAAQEILREAGVPIHVGGRPAR